MVLKSYIASAKAVNLAPNELAPVVVTLSILAPAADKSFIAFAALVTAVSSMFFTLSLKPLIFSPKVLKLSPNLPIRFLSKIALLPFSSDGNTPRILVTI